MRKLIFRFLLFTLFFQNINLIAQTDISGYFNNETSYQIVSCTLEGGVSSTCYEIKFASNPVDNGPYCPVDTNSIGGVGVYDGATNPGFQVMKKSLFQSMELDGYDIIRNNGTIRSKDLYGGGGGGSPSYAYCLENTADDALELTFLIPTTPFNPPNVNQMASVELVAISVDGVPMNSDPPSVVSNSGNIPAIDPCGGHMDPAGYYHWHFAPESINNVFSRYGISDVSCTKITQNVSALTGFAKDGYPIYASRDMDGSLATDLDECYGHTANTKEFGIAYHYHVSDILAPSMPPCIKGVSAESSFSVGALILPIDLISFEINNIENEKILLQWSTASELNNDFFTIERSEDGKVWEEILIINGAGDSHRKIDYLEYDNSPLEGTYYYRLKQTDFDDGFTYSDLRSVRVEKKITPILIYPQPATQDLFITNSNIQSITLIDYRGEIVFSQNLEKLDSDTTRVDVSHFGSGIYYLRIFDGDRYQTEKVIISNL